MSAPTGDRARGLARIVEIADEHGLDLDDIAAALSAPRAANDETPPKTATLTRLLAYLGGVFVFAGLGIFIAMRWQEMNSAARIVVTLGSGVAAFGMAVAATK